MCLCFFKATLLIGARKQPQYPSRMDKLYNHMEKKMYNNADEQIKIKQIIMSESYNVECRILLLVSRQKAKRT